MKTPLAWAMMALVSLSLPYPLRAQPIDFSLPQGAEITASQSQDMASYTLPKGPFHNGIGLTASYDLPLTRTAYRLPLTAQITTQTLMENLKSQAMNFGFDILFECHSAQCGGFDFRFVLDLLPEPEMHVDLGDYRYLQAQKPTDHGNQMLAIMVSASAKYGFVHLAQLGHGITAAPTMIAASKSPEPISQQTHMVFVANQPTVLAGIVFATGKFELQNPQPAALVELANWMLANPSAKVTLIGHTDAAGNANRNMVLSFNRAAALRDILVARYAIDPSRLAVIGRGGDQPIASNTTAEGRAQNRRVEVLIEAGLGQ
jgi:outer membrane protein OmpA-like peptidoglycan-associated protein